MALRGTAMTVQERTRADHAAASFGIRLRLSHRVEFGQWFTYYGGAVMLTDLQAAKRALKQWQASDDGDRVVEALEAIERCIEAAERPADDRVRVGTWDDVISDETLDAIFADDGFTDAERALLAKLDDANESACQCPAANCTTHGPVLAPESR